MGIAHVCRRRLEFNPVSGGDDNRSTSNHNRAHCYPDPAIWQCSRYLQATPRGDLDNRPTGQVVIEQVAHEDSDTVSTHLHDGSISVAVVHEPQRTIAIPAFDVLGEYGAK